MNAIDFFEEHHGVILFVAGVILLVIVIVLAVSTMDTPAPIINNAGVRIP